MNMRQEIANLKKSLILQEAAKHFDKSGYEATSVSQIAKDAEVSIGTIYGFFESKEGLFQAHILYKIETFTNFLKELVKNSEQTPKENLKTLLTYHFEDMRGKQKSMQEVLLASPVAMSQACNSACTPDNNPLIELHQIIASQLEILHKQEPLQSTDFLQMALILKSMAFSYVERWVLLDDIVLEDKVDECLTIFFKGIIK